MQCSTYVNSEKQKISTWSLHGFSCKFTLENLQQGIVEENSVESWYSSLNLQFISAEKIKGQKINKYQDRAAKYGINKKLC